MTLPRKQYDLPSGAFPFTVIAKKAVGGDWVWAVTVLRPKSGDRVELHIPPLRKEFGPVSITTIDGQGNLTFQFPDKRDVAREN